MRSRRASHGGARPLNCGVMRHRVDIGVGGALFALVAGLGMLNAWDVALAQSFAPARLVRLQGIDDLKCPVVSRQSQVLFCQVVVDERGDARNDTSTHCFGGLTDLDRARNLRAKILRSEFEPAKIDGEAVEVYASFRVVFGPKDDTCEITVLPNLGTEQDEFGLEYFAPQEIYTDGGWWSRIPKSQTNWRTSRSRGMAFSMSVAVDELGQASDGRVENNNFAPPEAVNSAVRALEMSRFVPLIVNGEPRPGRYFEFMYLPPRTRVPAYLSR
jgi:hypothetical protein